MTIAFIERPQSRESEVGEQKSYVERVYTATGSNDDSAIHAAVAGMLPATYLGLPLASYRISPIGNGNWDVAARYDSREPLESSSSYTFDTGGGTQHITQSLQTVQAKAAGGGTAPDFQQAISVTTDSVEGVDITVPIYTFTETHMIFDSLVTQAYKLTLFNLTGRTNNAAFKGFAAGEVLFLGASGSKRGNTLWEITFRFAASPNVSGLTLGSITGINKKGWEYLWVRYADAEDQKVLVKQPIAAYVERVYESGNFAGLGIGV